MEGRHGIEVWEIHQFGDKMGMTDQGEFIKSVPAKYYLFFHYHLVGSMYYLESKIVDDKELEERLNRAESMVAEGTDAACQQTMSKAVSPKEPMHDEDDDGTVSTKKAVEVSMRRKDKKLSADSLDEAITRKQKDMAVRRFMSHDPKAGETILTMGKKDREEKKSFASAKKEIKGLREEEQMEEGRMPASVIKHKQKLANMTPDELKKKFAGKSEEHLRSMARRHGYGPDSDVYSKHVTVKEDNLDEVSLGKLVRYKNKAGEGREKGVALADKKMKGKSKVNASMPKHPYMEETDAADETNMAKTQLKAIGAKSSNLASMMKNPKNLPAWVQSKLSVAKDGITSVDDYMTHSDKKLDEKAPPGAKYERMVKHIKAGYAKDGLTKKEKGIAFATAWKAKNKEKSD
jgi:hypothetical protein